MPRADFYLTFDSDADKFGAKLATELKAARSELGEFANQAQEIENQLRRTGGKGQFSRLITSIGEANSIIQEMVDGLAALKTEFQQLAGSMKTIAKGAGPGTGRPAPGTPLVETSNAGRVSPSAQADTGRVAQLPKEALELVRTYDNHKKGIERLERELEDPKRKKSKTDIRKNIEDYTNKRTAASVQLMRDFNLTMEQIEEIALGDVEKAMTAGTQDSKKGSKAATTRKATSKKSSGTEQRVAVAAEQSKKKEESLQKTEQQIALESKSVSELQKRHAELIQRRGEIGFIEYTDKQGNPQRYNKYRAHRGQSQALKDLQQERKDIEAALRERGASLTAELAEADAPAPAATSKATDGTRELMKLRNKELRALASQETGAKSTSDKAKLARAQTAVDKAKEARIEQEKKASEEDLAAFRAMDREPSDIEDNRALQKELSAALRKSKPAKTPETPPSTTGKSPVQEQAEQVIEQTEQTQKGVEQVAKSAMLDEEAFQKLIAARDAANARRQAVGQKSPGTKVKDGRFHKREGDWEYKQGATRAETEANKTEFKAADDEYRRLKDAVSEQSALRRAAREAPEAETTEATEALREIATDEAEQVQEAVEQAQLSKAARLQAIRDEEKRLQDERGQIAWQPKGKGTRWVARDEKDKGRVKEISQRFRALSEEYRTVSQLEDDNDVLVEVNEAKEASNAQLQEVLTKLGPLYQRRQELVDAGQMTAVTSGPQAGTFRVKGDEKSKAEGRALKAQIRELEEQAKGLGVTKIGPGEATAEGEAPKAAVELGNAIDAEVSKTASDVQSIMQMRSIAQEKTDQAIAKVQELSQQLGSDPSLAFQEPSEQQKGRMQQIRDAGGVVDTPSYRQPLDDASFVSDPDRIPKSMVAIRDALGEDIVGLRELIKYLESELKAASPQGDKGEGIELPEQRDLRAFLDDARTQLAERQGRFEQVDQSGFSRSLTEFGLMDEATQDYVTSLDARMASITGEIKNVDAGLYKGMGEAAAGDYKDDLKSERNELKDLKKRALDARRLMMNQLIETFPVEALSGLDEGALRVPESLQGKLAQDMTDRGTPLATGRVRDLFGRTTSVQPLAPKWRKNAIGAGSPIPGETSEQEHELLRTMMRHMPAYTPGQVKPFQAALLEQQRLAEANQGIFQERMQAAVPVVENLLESMPELSLSELRQVLTKSEGVSKEARTSLLAAARFVDSLTQLNPEAYSPARVAGAEKRHGSRIMNDMRFQERRAKLARRTGDTEGLTKKQKRIVNEKDLRGAFWEAFYDDRQVSGEKRGLTERTFRLFDSAGDEGLRSQARTPRQKDALKVFEDRMRQGLGVAASKGVKIRAGYKDAGLTPTFRDPKSGAIKETDLAKALEGAETDEQRSKIQALIDLKKQLEQDETDWLKDIRDRWEDLQNALSGQLDPEAQERIDRLNQERKDLGDARESVGLSRQPPELRSFRVPREGELAERMGVHRPRVSAETIAEAEAERDAAQVDLDKLKKKEDAKKGDVDARTKAYGALRAAAEQAAEALADAERAPAPASERTQRLTRQQQVLEQFERDETKRRATGQRTLKPDLVAAAEGAGIDVKTRMTKDDLSAALAARKGQLGSELRESQRADRESKVIPPELADEAQRLATEAATAKTELAGAKTALSDFYEQVRKLQDAVGGYDRRVMELRGEDHSPATVEQHQFEKLNDAIRKVEAKEITETKQIPKDIRDAQGIADHGEDLATPLRQMQTARHALMMKHMGQYMDFDPMDERFKDPTVSPEEMYARFDDFAREVQGSGRTPDDAAREDLARQQAAEEPYKQELGVALERVQRQRATEEARRAQTRGGGMGECCDRMVSILEKIHSRLVAGLKVTGRGQGGGKEGLTKAQMVDVARAGGVKGFSKMRKAELEEALRGAGLLEPAERESARARRQVEAEEESLPSDFLQRVQRGELPARAQEFLADRRDAGDMVPDKALDNAAQLVRLLQQSGYHQDEASRVARTQLGLSEQQGAQLRERLVRLRAESRGVTVEEEDANAERARGVQLYGEQLRMLQLMSPETQDLVRQSRDLTQAAREGRATPEQAQEAQIQAADALERDMAQFRTPDGRVAMSAGDRHRNVNEILGTTSKEYSEVETRRRMRRDLNVMQNAMQAEAPRLQGTLSNMIFGGHGFLERAARSTGTFIVRNMTAGMVFGATRMLRELVREAIHTEAQFIRVSDALEATGRSAAGVRTELMRISTDIGRPLDEVYEIAGNITGAFDDVRDVEFGTRIVAQLELISDGVLNAKEGFDALQTIAAAFELEGVGELARIQDTAVALQHVMAIGVEDTVQGIGGLAGIAAEMNFELEETAVLVAAVAKGTNQGGKAAQQANIKATFGSRREARAFNALINRRVQILQTLTEAENAYGLGQQRVEEVMREIANQIKIAGTNFTNFGAVLVRSGVLNFFGVMLRGFNATMSTVNEFLSVLNDLADANPIARFARDASGVLGGLVITMAAVRIAADRMIASLAAHAAAEQSLAQISTTTITGRAIHRAAARAGTDVVAGAAAGTTAAGTAVARRKPIIAGAAVGALARPRGRLSRTPGGGVVGRNTQMTQQQAIDAGLIDPVTGLLIAQGLRGFAPKLTRGVGRGMQGIGERIMRRSSPLGVAGAHGRLGARLAGPATLSRSFEAGKAAKAGAGLAALGKGVAALSTAAAWGAVAAVSALGAAIYALFDAAGNDQRRQEEAFNLIAPFMNETQRERFEERRRLEDRGWMQRIGESFRGPDDEERRRRKEELDAMLPGERLIAQQLDERDLSDRLFGDDLEENVRSWYAQDATDIRPLNEAFGVNWGSIDFSEWFTGNAFENYEPLPGGSSAPFGLGNNDVDSRSNFEQQIRGLYEREYERIQNEVRTGRQAPGLPDASRRTLSDLGNELDEIISVDDDTGAISVRDVDWLSDDKDTRLDQINRIRTETTDAIAAEAAVLEEARSAGEISEGEFVAASAALADIRNNRLAQIEQLERQALGLSDINQLTATQLDDFISAMDAIEGVSIPQMAACGEGRAASARCDPGCRSGATGSLGASCLPGQCNGGDRSRARWRIGSRGRKGHRPSAQRH